MTKRVIWSVMKHENRADRKKKYFFQVISSRDRPPSFSLSVFDQYFSEPKKFLSGKKLETKKSSKTNFLQVAVFRKPPPW